MKRIVCVILSLLFVLPSFNVFAASDVKMILNGKEILSDVSPMIVDDSTMVPFRVISQEFGAEVNWNDSLKKAYATYNNTTVILTIGSKKMLVNSDIVDLAAAPIIFNNSTLVPARAVFQAFGCDVQWDGETKTVTIKTADYAEPKPYIGTIDDSPSYYTKGDAYMAEKLAKLINETRAENGLSELLYNNEIADVALVHSTDMAVKDYLSHIAPDGTTPTDRLSISGIDFISNAENLASGYANAEDVLNAWMKSPAHSENILNPEFTQIGVGYYVGGENGYYWTLILISK